MKHRVFLIAALFACLLGGLDASAAEEARKIEQFIAKNIDGSNSDFSFICQNSTDSSYYVDEFLTGGNRLNLSTETKIVNLAVAKYPAQVHHLLYKCYFVNYDIFFSAIRTKELQKQKKAIVLSWNIRNLEEEEALSWDYSRKIYLSWNIDSNMDFFHKNQKDGIFAEIIKLMDGNNLSFALLFANHTSKKIVLTDLYGDGNQVKLKFPNGRVFTPPLKKDAKNMELNPGESKTFKIELEQLLKESKDFSMKDFEFGLTELVWEMKLDKEHAITRNFWLVKFNGELPEAHADSGYKLDGPLTLETFRDKKISALPAPHAYFGNKDIESETKETSAQSTEQ